MKPEPLQPPRPSPLPATKNNLGKLGNTAGMYERVSAEIEDLMVRYSLESWQVGVAKEFAKPKALRPQMKKMCEIYGCTENQLNYWRRHPVAMKIRMELTRLWFFNDIPDVMLAMRDKALQGSEPAARLFFEMVLELKTYDTGQLPIQSHFSEAEVTTTIIEIRRKFKMPIPPDLLKLIEHKKPIEVNATQ